MIRRRPSLAARLVLGALVWLTVLLSVGGLVLADAFRSAAERGFEHRLEALARAMIAAVEVTPDGVVLAHGPGDPRFDRIYSGWYWQLSGPGDWVERSRSLWDASLTAHSGSGVRQVRKDVGPAGEPLLVIESDLDFPGASGTVHLLVAGDLRETAAEVARFDRLLAGALAVLGLGMLGAVFVQVRFGLQPLRRLAAELGAVRRGTAARLGEGHPREIEPLVKAMNGVLDHDAELIERARTHLGNLAHGLKTPLAVLKTGLRDPELTPQIDAMERLIRHQLVRATAATGSGRALSARLAVVTVLAEMRDLLLRLHAEKRLSISVDAAPDAVFPGPREDLEEILGNLLDNACKWGRGLVRATAAMEAGALVLAVEDDGPGLTDGEAAAATRRGARFDEMTPGSGLGLAIVADLVGLYGGSVAFGRSPLGGVQVALRIPLPKS